MSDLKLESFTPHVGSTFSVATDGLPLELTLAEASPAGVGEIPSGVRAPFSLLFRGPAGPILPQSIYRLDHLELGALDIFLVPISADAEGVTYQAVFA